MPAQEMVAAFQTAHPDETLRWGHRLAELWNRNPPASGGLRVALGGPLGSGKTQLAKGLFGPFGIEPERVVSPSFTLINEYAEGLLHLDLYRLRTWDDLETLGLDEILESARVAVIEWAQRFDLLERWGLEHLEVRMDFGPEEGAPGTRNAVVKAHGPTYHGLLETLRAEKALAGR